MSDQPNIEACFAHIEEAVAALEDGDLELERALAVYEGGLAHIRQAKLQLDAFAERLQALREEADGDDDEVE